ncbi:MAG: hypothetical protein A2275_10925 [Bacteroidetes bacterium RIFOXYA12_FULL_35_11]|nr:MAG: hypothetical protein A2X01_08485 [Bacteroidetes bacterium GWF2_35_48]OFY74587.1 MAG: hypothetical protein A2275_10925 [Bacteroidetes bacterium RIFOXYA12_FULL_35_11]OFY92440.1 MAG: hypothetical protein A2309_12590 [Bacteroidetes bacterium RIFOXYB2_FULL_35_7]OFY97811.1 MAG: hypothetical protein A2491_08290 [Bacteroidetes bacterium RIFOXYC12_FULL_35_7]
MLEYTKLVLQKVSFDKSLFAKELKKSLQWLKDNEVKVLQTWALSTFAVYSDIIKEVFENINY